MASREPLTDGWQVCALATNGELTPEQVRKLGDGEGDNWLPASMPTQVHEILLGHGRIDDPIRPDAENCPWVSERDWLYRASFAAPAEAERVYLHFTGLDTLADVYLNGQKLAHHRDQFLPLRREVTERLQDDNVLLVHFYSPGKWLQEHPLPEQWEGKVKHHNLLRKNFEGQFLNAPEGWVLIGIFDDVLLESFQGLEIGEVDLDYTLTEGYAEAEVTATVRGCGNPAGGMLRVRVQSPDGSTVARVETSLERTGGGWHARAELKIREPRLWWPRGYGDQPLYAFTFEAVAGAEVQDRMTRRTGFRDVQMGEPFDFSVNGKRVKLWGANLTPLDGISRVWDSGRFLRLMDLVEQCNMTSLRAWGPGAPYDAEMFEECDRRGILLWAEFFHTWGVYPDDEAYRELCRREAEHYVKSRKHHPCILLWCGGNESCMAADMAGYGEDFIGKCLFETDYKAVCQALDPGRFYWPNSPSGGAFANDPLAGDSHSYTHQYYVPGEDYPVLFTENTRASTPLLKTLRRVLGHRLWPDEGFDGTLRGPQDRLVPDSWTELTLGYDFLFVRQGLVEELYETADTPEGLIYRLGAGHALYIRRYVERYRRGRPSTDPHRPRRSMGHYLWKLNNTWPMIYSNVVDYFLEPNMAFYALRGAYQPLLLSFDIGDHIWLWLVNDSADDVRGRVVFQLMGMAGDVHEQLEQAVHVPAGESRVVMDLDQIGMFGRQDCLFARLLDEDGNLLTRANDFAEYERRLKLPAAELTLEHRDGALEITTDRFARSVELRGDADGEEFGWWFEDNFFDLLPGEVKRVRILGDHAHGTVTARAFFSDQTASVTF